MPFIAFCGTTQNNQFVVPTWNIFFFLIFNAELTGGSRASLNRCCFLSPCFPVCMRFPASLHPPSPSTSGTCWKRRTKPITSTTWRSRLVIATSPLTSTFCPWGPSSSGNSSCPSIAGSTRRRWGGVKMLSGVICSYLKKSQQTSWNMSCTSSTRTPVSCWCTGPGRGSRVHHLDKTRWGEGGVYLFYQKNLFFRLLQAFEFCWNFEITQQPKFDQVFLWSFVDLWDECDHFLCFCCLGQDSEQERLISSLQDFGLSGRSALEVYRSLSPSTRDDSNKSKNKSSKPVKKGKGGKGDKGKANEGGANPVKTLQAVSKKLGLGSLSARWEAVPVLNSLNMIYCNWTCLLFFQTRWCEVWKWKN